MSTPRCLATFLGLSCLLFTASAIAQPLQLVENETRDRESLHDPDIAIAGKQHSNNNDPHLQTRRDLPKHPPKIRHNLEADPHFESFGSDFHEEYKEFLETDEFLKDKFSYDVRADVDAIRTLLHEIGGRINRTSAAIILATDPKSGNLSLLVTSPKENKPATLHEMGIPAATVREAVQEFYQLLQSPTSKPDDYLPLARHLYHWLFEPIEEDLAGIEHLILVPGEGFRVLPFAALYDGKQFLVEKYSFAVTPSFSLLVPVPEPSAIEHDPLDPKHFRHFQPQDALLFGITDFSFDPELPNLPGVVPELDRISADLSSEENATIKPWTNETVTEANLRDRYERIKREEATEQDSQYPIVHLATHAVFENERPLAAYLQLWDKKLRLNDMRKLAWNDPQVELLILSACDTAIESPQAELGFVSLALRTGAKSAIGSLWKANDMGTLGLMSEFYYHIAREPSKMHALQEAQLSLLKGQIKGQIGLEGDRLVGLSGDREPIPLPIDLPAAADLERASFTFTHPYFWAGFTLVGYPW